MPQLAFLRRAQIKQKLKHHLTSDLKGYEYSIPAIHSNSHFMSAFQLNGTRYNDLEDLSRFEWANKYMKDHIKRNVTMRNNSKMVIKFLWIGKWQQENMERRGKNKCLSGNSKSWQWWRASSRGSSSCCRQQWQLLCMVLLWCGQSHS